jgi:hypothetical protein
MLSKKLKLISLIICFLSFLKISSTNFSDKNCESNFKKVLTKHCTKKNFKIIGYSLGGLSVGTYSLYHLGFFNYIGAKYYCCILKKKPVFILR